MFSSRSAVLFAVCGAGGLLFVAAGGAIGAFWALESSEFPRHQPFLPQQFDPSLWNRPDWRGSFPEGSWHTIRQRMVDDLLERHLRVGMSESEVLELLGPWDEEAHFREPDPDAWVYWLGLERSPYGADSEWLFVSFDSQGAVARAFLATD